jgi:hypothetical protein
VIGLTNLRRSAPLRPLLLAAALMLIGGAAGGCASALAVAPMGIEAAGVGISAVGSKAEARKEPGRRDDEDDAEYHERCDDLEQATPPVIEIHRAQNSDQPQWRELRLSNSGSAPLWTSAAADGASWYPLARLSGTRFTPPLAMPKPGASAYLAYAPAEPMNAAEQDQLASLAADFGTNSGTFVWNGRVYDYAIVDTLPCFAPPAVALR